MPFAIIFKSASTTLSYTYPAVSVARNIPFAGAKLPECTACTDLSGLAIQLTSACVRRLAFCCFLMVQY